MTNTAVGEAERIHDSTVKDLDTIYMQQQVVRAGLPTRQAIGVDEFAIRKGHHDCLVVSDLDCDRRIWVGGKGRTEAGCDLFFAVLDAKKTARIQLAAMDMWKPFRHLLTRNAPQARSSLTNSTSCVTSATRATRSAVVSTTASPPRTALSSRCSDSVSVLMMDDDGERNSTRRKRVLPDAHREAPGG